MINKIVCYENNQNLLLYTDKGILHARITIKYRIKWVSGLKELVKDSASLLRSTDIMEVKHLGDRQRNILPISPDVEILDELPIPYEIGE